MLNSQAPRKPLVHPRNQKPSNNAASDSGAEAGIQADPKAMAAMGSIACLPTKADTKAEGLALRHAIL